MKTPAPDTTAPAKTANPAKAGGEPLVVFDSQTLMQGQREILIRHQERIYRLQATRLGKLILTR